MKLLSYLTVSEHKGMSRLYIDGKRLLSSFEPGEFYQVEEKTEGTIVLKKSATGLKVSKRKRKESIYPVIDCRNELFGTLFGIGAKVRVVLKKGLLIISTHKQTLKRRKRERDFVNNVKEGKPLKLASLFSGAGILDSALMKGFRDAGIEIEHSLSVEKEGRYLDLMAANQSDDLGSSLLLNGGIEDLDIDNAQNFHILAAGIPCEPASIAGVTKNGNKIAEDHPDTGDMAFWLLRAVEAMQPSIIILENVVNYVKTASFSIIRSVLSRLGYLFGVRTLNGNEFGALENRDRMCVVAVSKGLGEFDLETVKPVASKEPNIACVLSNIPLDDPRWRTYAYLDEKKKRDVLKGNGFGRSIVDGSEGKCKVLREGYAKGGSNETFVQHPTNPSLSRLFTDQEHSLMKKIPLYLTQGEVETVRHRALGQSVIYTAFEAVAFFLGAFFKRNSWSFV